MSNLSTLSTKDLIAEYDGDHNCDRSMGDACSVCGAILDELEKRPEGRHFAAMREAEAQWIYELSKEQE